MGKHVVVVGLAAAACMIAGGSLGPSIQRSRPPLARPHLEPGVRRVERDSRRIEPGTHRAGPAELAVRNRVAQAESAKLAARARLRAQAGPAAAPSVPATAWVSLGPTDALNELNVVPIAGVDSGRLNSILVDPRDPNVVYIAGSGGGAWKTFNFLSASGPSWTPLTDTLPNLAAGALAFDEASPDTLYLGNGDFIDASGNTILKSIDGGASWGPPVVLAGQYPAPNGFPASVAAVRAIGVRGARVLVGTDVGLFASASGGASFALVDLPNVNGKILTESIWSVVHTGGGHWVASGVTGCDEASGPAPIAGGVDPQLGCDQGNNGEIWYSADGVSWTQAVLPSATGIGRLTLAAGATSNPASTVVYAFVGSTDGFSTVGFWRSMDGGVTWADATGTLANPTVQVGTRVDCGDLGVGQSQTWYNQAIVVDPTNPDRVLVGGSLCSARTLNGTDASPTWQLVSHWLPEWDGGKTANGQLPYVHADWHTAISVTVGGVLRTFAGTDGGLFTSTDLFNPSTQPEHVTWVHHNRGLVTHLLYNLASGDPASGDPFVLFAGLQDNGTRYRAGPATPSVFNQPIGGDGIGATIHHSTAGTTYWASVEFGHLFCRPSATLDCGDGNNWTDADSPIDPGPPTDGEDGEGRGPPRSERAPARSRAGGENAEPFFIHYANVETDTDGHSVLTHSNVQVFVSLFNGIGFTWRPISQDLTAAGNGQGIANVTASRTTPNLYGAAGLVSLAPFYVTTAGNTATTWTAAKPVFPTGTTARLTGASSIDFPPVQPPGTVPGQVFIGSFTSTMNDLARTPPPDDKGHLWRTTDFGQTWTSIVGADPAHRLPNVAVFVAKYDPVTPTTIYAGTELGVYITTDDGATWNRMGEGFPMVPVRDIYVARNQEFIRVATYGRGLWEIYPSAAANQGAPGNGDYDRNLRFDWIDLAAMSSRVGTTPATTAPPFYSWIMDMIAGASDPPLQQIDDTDLDALLTKFGGHP